MSLHSLFLLVLLPHASAVPAQHPAAVLQQALASPSPDAPPPPLVREPAELRKVPVHDLPHGIGAQLRDAAPR